MSCGPLLRLVECNSDFLDSDLHSIATACLNGLDYYHSQGYLHCVCIWKEYHNLGYYPEQSLYHCRLLREAG